MQFHGESSSGMAPCSSVGTDPTEESVAPIVTLLRTPILSETSVSLYETTYLLYY